MTKIAVANGLGPSDEYLNSIEVLDLSPEARRCRNLPDFPIKAAGQIGGLMHESSPLLCGGHNYGERFEICYAVDAYDTWMQARMMANQTTRFLTEGFKT